MNKPGIVQSGIFCKQSRPSCIYNLGRLHFSFGFVNGSISGTVDYKFRFFLIKKIHYLAFVGYIQRIRIGKQKVVSSNVLSQLFQFASQLSVCSGYKYFHPSKIKFISAAENNGAAKSFSETTGSVSPSIQSILSSGSFIFIARSESLLYVLSH